jgi:hypothetical protein
MSSTNKKIIIFVIIGLLILISVQYVSFARIKRWTTGWLGKRDSGPAQEKGIDLNFETSKRSVCKISGTVYIKGDDINLQKTNDAVFRYRNIDTQARVIYWNFSPEDEIKAAPNMFAQLNIPDSEYFPVAFFFRSEPKYKEYTAKATITYGDWINGKVESGKRDCEGEIKIIIDEDWE